MCDLQGDHKSKYEEHGESLLLEYRDDLLRKKDLAQTEQDKQEIEQLVELVDDLDDLFEHG